MTFAHFVFILPLRIFAAMAKALFHSWFKLRWTPSSKSWLMHLDQKIRTHITHKNHGEWVPITMESETHEVWTVTVEGDKSDVLPMVMVHGMGGGCNMFLNNIDTFAEQRDIYLLDLPGFGLSSRPELRVKYEDGWWQETSVDDIEAFYCELMEKWFTKMGLQKFILLGHSYGGYLSSVYCLKYPSRVKHLVLADPWGFPLRPKNMEQRPFMRSKLLYVLSKLYGKMNIFTPIRALGPLALPLFRIFKIDIKEKFTSKWVGRELEMSNLEKNKLLMMEERMTLFPDMTMQDYCYAWMMNCKSGETGFFRVSIPFAMARKPILERVQDWDPGLDVTFIYGARSWVDSHAGFETKYQRQDSYVDVHVISGAGHHMYADRPLAFNHIVTLVGQAVDSGVKPNISQQTELRSKAMSSLRRRISHSSSQGDFINDEAGIRQPHAQNPATLSSSSLAAASSSDVDISSQGSEKGSSTTSLSQQEGTGTTAAGGGGTRSKVSFTLESVPDEMSESDDGNSDDTEKETKELKLAEHKEKDDHEKDDHEKDDESRKHEAVS